MSSTSGPTVGRRRLDPLAKGVHQRVGLPGSVRQSLVGRFAYPAVALVTMPFSSVSMTIRIVGTNAPS